MRPAHCAPARTTKSITTATVCKGPQGKRARPGGPLSRGGEPENGTGMSDEFGPGYQLDDDRLMTKTRHDGGLRLLQRRPLDQPA
jgi:hypothetical protein